MLEKKIKFRYNRKLLRIVSLPCVCVCVHVRMHMHTHSVPQYSLTLCDPIDRSLPGSSVHGIL